MNPQLQEFLRTYSGRMLKKEEAQILAKTLRQIAPTTQLRVSWAYDTEMPGMYHFSIEDDDNGEGREICYFRAYREAAQAFIAGIGHVSWDPQNMRTWDDPGGDIPLEFDAEAVSDL